MRKVRLFFDKVVNSVVIFFVMAMIAVISLQIICRLFFSSLSWSEELARYLFVWITFLGAAICARENAHIGMDYLVKKFPEKYGKIVEKIGFLIMIVISIIVMIWSIPVVLLNMHQTSPALKLNMGLVYSIIPIGFAYSAFYYTEYLLGKKDETSMLEKEEENIVT